MPDPLCDETGFTCECGARNDYPAYVQEHRNVKLVYSCGCRRQYVLYRGTVSKQARRISDDQENDEFGD